MHAYEFLCTPPNERSTVIRLEAHTLEEAVQRAERMWCHQQHKPRLLAIVDLQPQKALAF